jgi:hypothetical protein
MNKIKTLILIIVATVGLSVFAQTPQTGQPAQKQTYQVVKSLDMVARPNFYLNKYVTVKGRFDKFSTLGLDYKPAMRSSEDYISFLIQRDDVKNHNVPLSEMKVFIKRKEAEKYIDLNAGDEVEFSGKVFSNALGDVWMDADKFTVLTQKPKKG